MVTTHGWAPKAGGVVAVVNDRHGCYYQADITGETDSHWYTSDGERYNKRTLKRVDRPSLTGGTYRLLPIGSPEEIQARRRNLAECAIEKIRELSDESLPNIERRRLLGLATDALRDLDQSIPQSTGIE